MGRKRAEAVGKFARILTVLLLRAFKQMLGESLLASLLCQVSRSHPVPLPLACVPSAVDMKADDQKFNPVILCWTASLMTEWAFVVRAFTCGVILPAPANAFICVCLTGTCCKLLSILPRQVDPEVRT